MTGFRFHVALSSTLSTSLPVQWKLCPGRRKLCAKGKRHGQPVAPTIISSCVSLFSKQVHHKDAVCGYKLKAARVLYGNLAAASPVFLQPFVSNSFTCSEAIPCFFTLSTWARRGRPAAPRLPMMRRRQTTNTGRHCCSTAAPKDSLPRRTRCHHRNTEMESRPPGRDGGGKVARRVFVVCDLTRSCNMTSAVGAT